MDNNSIDAYLAKTKLGFTNGKEVPEISSILSNYGYTPQKIDEGLQLQAEAEANQNMQKKEYGEQYAATAKQKSLFAQSKKIYSQHLALGRLRFADNVGLQQTLRLNGRRKQSLSGWIADAKLFYENGLSSNSVIEGLSKYNITRENLQEGLNLVMALEKSEADQQKETGEAQAATKKRDVALQNLADYYEEFAGVAKVALTDNPDMLDMLGM